jgi:hypothetical protein
MDKTSVFKEKQQHWRLNASVLKKKRMKQNGHPENQDAESATETMMLDFDYHSPLNRS